MSESLQLPEWYPDWAPARRVDRNAEPAAQPPAADQEDYVRSAGDPQVHEAPQSRSAGEDVSQYTLSSSNPPVADNTDGFSRAPPKEIIVTPNRDRMVKRKLKGIHLFMITINATLGTGLYWRGGQILQLGGPLAVLLSFLLVGFLSWAVMQCITELLCIWPVPGALSVYVSEFVDVELGIAVGIAYWFTYSVSFAALIATSAAEFDFWPSFSGNQGIDGGIVYFCIPLVLLLINAFGIEAYGLFEVISGTIKISFLFVIVVFLIAINSGAGPNDKPSLGASLWNKPTEFDGNAANHWFIALLMCISIATFAYVGVEIVAASALEAQWPRRTTQNEAMWNAARSTTLVGTTVKFSSIFISVLATIAYTISSLIASFDIESTNPRLPRLSWTGYIPPEPSDQSTASAFVAIAQQSGIPHLADVFNAFLVFTCLTCANTNLYVASRSLFGLTSRLDGGSGQPWYIQILAWFGRTNNRKVPMRAVVFSAVAFIWVPFLQLRGGTGADTPIGIFIEVLAEMGSVGVLIVWACECVAFIRYYRCIHQHRAALEAQKVSQVRRWSQEEYHDYPYRSHGQPLLAYIALAGCIFVLVVANGAALWNGFHLLPFLSSYLIVVVFLGMWLVLKIVRNARWSFVDLSNPQRVVKKIKDLHDLRLSAS